MVVFIIPLTSAFTVCLAFSTSAGFPTIVIRACSSFGVFCSTNTFAFE